MAKCNCRTIKKRLKEAASILCVIKGISYSQSNQQILKEAASNSHHALYYESSSEEEELEEDKIVDNLTRNYQGINLKFIVILLKIFKLKN